MVISTGILLDLLATYHNIEISRNGLCTDDYEWMDCLGENPEYDVDTIIYEVEGMLDGPACISGYRHVWHSLQLKGYQVPRQVVELL